MRRECGEIARTINPRMSPGTRDPFPDSAGAAGLLKPWGWRWFGFRPDLLGSGLGLIDLNC